MTQFAISRRGALALSAGLPLSACATSPPTQPAKLGQDWTQARRIEASIAKTRFPRRTFQPMNGVTAPATNARALIQTAIDTCHNHGGGRVVVSAGEWAIEGPLHLKSNVNLHLSEGANLVFSGDHSRYLPVVFVRWEGTECWNYSPFIYAFAQTNIGLTGKGTLNGQGQAHWLPFRQEQRVDQNLLRDMGRDGVPVAQRVFGDGRKLRPCFVEFVSCTRVLIEDITLRDSPFWCVHPVYCSDVIVRNISIVSRHINSDGVDPDSCNRVLIENCRFDVGDDGVSIKAGRDQDGWRVGKVCENIVVRNCQYLGLTGGGLAIGSEMSGGVRKIFVDGLTLATASHGLYFKANLDRGGFIEDVFITNVRAGSVRAFIKFSNDFHSYRGGNFPTLFRRITISDAICDTAVVGLHVSGDARAPIEAVSLSNVIVKTAQQNFQVAHVRDLQLNNVSINSEVVTTMPQTAKETWVRLPN